MSHLKPRTATPYPNLSLRSFPGLGLISLLSFPPVLTSFYCFFQQIRLRSDLSFLRLFILFLYFLSPPFFFFSPWLPLTQAVVIEILR